MFYIIAWIIQSLFVPFVYKNFPVTEQALLIIINGMVFISIAFMLEIKDLKKGIIKAIKNEGWNKNG